MKTNLIIASGAALLAFSSCKNPADETADAKIGEAAPVASASGGERYEFTEQSTIGFIGSKVTGSHEGGFKTFTGHFVLQDDKPVAGEFVIDMTSTWADHDDLASHLKNADFFDVEQFPEASFKVSAFTMKDETNYELSGNLSLHGVTKNITFPATVEKGPDLIRVSSEFDLNRHDFGMTFKGKPDDLIRKEVVIKFALEAKAQ